MAVGQDNYRWLVEQILEQRGFKPEALPNLYDLSLQDREIGSNPPRVPSSMRAAIDDLVKWRQIFPETVDSIVALHSSGLPRTNWSNTPAGKSIARLMMQPHASLIAADRGDYLPEDILASEPAGPRFSTTRYAGYLPSEVLFNPGAEGFGWVSDQERREMHPVTRRRLVKAISGDIDTRIPSQGGTIRGFLDQRQPRWGDRIAADTLVYRLQSEHPEMYDELVKQTTGRGWTGPNAPTPGQRFHPRRELTRRIAAIYSADASRHSGWNVNPDLYLDEERIAGSADPTYTPGMSTLERMKRSEFRPGQKGFLDEAEMLQRHRDISMWADLPEDDLLDFTGRQGEVVPGALGEYEKGLARSAQVARNPTNVRIQEFLNRNLGPRGMMGQTTVPFALRGAGSAAVGLLAPLVADRLIKDEAKRNLAQSAIMGGGLGGILGWKGALAGAGIGALASQLFG